MKVRVGFVSNSSSSSFIVGIGVVKDEAKINELNKDVSSWDAVEILDVQEILDGLHSDGWSRSVSGGRYHVESFNGHSVSSPKLDKLPPDAKLAVWNFAGNEGDCAFTDDNGDWDDGYDIDEDFFDEGEQKMMSAFYDESIIVKGELVIGAGRNG